MLDAEPYFKTRLGRLYCGDALEVLKKLPSECVDVVITSPPYWAKRDYGESACKVWGGDPNCDHEWEFDTVELNLQSRNEDFQRPWRDKASGKVVRGFCKKCGAWYGQLGMEPTPQMFVDHLVEIFREVKRVLKPTGSLFVVIDDTWSQRGKGFGTIDPKYPSGRNTTDIVLPARSKGFDVPQKSLCLVPELFAIKMVYEEGWILREKIIWCKKVHFYKDRTTYGNAMPESVKDRFCHTWEYIYHFTKSQKYHFNLDAVRVPHKESSIIRDSLGYKTSPMKGRYQVPWEKRDGTNDQSFLHPLGANPGDVVQINVRPFKDAHFAVFPPEIPEILIKVACPENGIVLDPFAGAGTTLVVAEKMGRKWIGIEINPDYCEIIKRRFESELRGLIYSDRLF